MYIETNDKSNVHVHDCMADASGYCNIYIATRREVSDSATASCPKALAPSEHYNLDGNLCLGKRNKLTDLPPSQENHVAMHNAPVAVSR